MGTSLSPCFITLLKVCVYSYLCVWLLLRELLPRRLSFALVNAVTASLLQCSRPDIKIANIHVHAGIPCQAAHDMITPYFRAWP